MNKQIVEVAIPVSISVNAVFDYYVPTGLTPSIATGCRVLVPFGPRTILGYVVKLKKYSSFEKKLKPIIKNLDILPVLDENLFNLAKKISEDYFCSFAGAIEATLPASLRKTRNDISPNNAMPPRTINPVNLSQEELALFSKKELNEPVVLIHDLSNSEKWRIYTALIKKTLNAKKSVILLVPDYKKIDFALNNLNLGITPYVISSRIKPKDCLNAWVLIKNAEFSFVIGTRSAVFSPVNNLGVIIIEEEEHFAYRQDQVPHYRTADIAFQRAVQCKAQVVLGSFMPSLDSYYLTKNGQAAYLKIEAKEKYAQVKTIDTQNETYFKRKGGIISKILEYRIADALQKKEKLLIFANKKGFSTFLYCKKCKKMQSCPRCSSSLRYDLKEKVVFCPICQHKAPYFEICPQCKSSYIKFYGCGCEKIESEIIRLFPQVKIFSYDKEKKIPENYDIILATQQFLEDANFNQYSFDTTCVIACEQMLEHPDFRCSEKAFSKLLKLLSITKKELCLQAQIPDNYVLRFLAQEDITGFLEYELGLRQELNLPPVKQMAVLAIRSKDETRSSDSAKVFYKKIRKACVKNKDLEIFEPMPSIPYKVRGNFKNQILVKYNDLSPIQKCIKPIIEDKKYKVIVTFDPYL